MVETVSYQTEYILYAYDHGKPDARSPERWKKLLTSYDVTEAVEQARHLFDSQKYRKIEIQKKYFDRKEGRLKAATLRTYGTNKALNLYVFWSITLLAVASAGLFYLYIH